MLAAPHLTGMDVRNAAARAGAVDTLTAHGAPKACQPDQVCDSATAPGGETPTRGGGLIVLLVLAAILGGGFFLLG